jgi:lysylphosphatidylglycerol synthetase-like protein (DUF2156 family)
MKPWLTWTPRILCLLFAVFLSLFALDVFGQGFGYWETVLALLMHLIPTGIVLVVLAVSWRWERIGAILFMALGIWYLLTAWGRFHWSADVVISGPLLLIGVLFLASWLNRTRIQSTT